MAGNTTISDIYDRVFTSTRTRVFAPGLFDNITADIPAIYYFQQAGRVQRVPGGAALEFNAFKELPAAVGAKAGDPVTPVFLDPATRGRYIWKNLYVPFKMAGQDMRKNEGEDAIIDFVAMHVEAAFAGMQAALGGTTLGLWGPSSADETDATVLTSLNNLVKTVGNTTGTTGGISRTNAWWENTAGTAITSFATNGIAGWRSALFAGKRMNESADVVLTNNTQLQNYLNTLTNTYRMNFPIEARVASEASVDAGISETSFYGVRIVGDANALLGAPSTAFFLNTKYLQLYVKDDTEMVLSEVVKIWNEDSYAASIVSMLNLCATSLARQSYVTGGDTA